MSVIQVSRKRAVVWTMIVFAAVLAPSGAALATVKLPMCWIDAKTGHKVLTGPPGWSPTGSGAGGYMPDANHVEFGGHTFVRPPGGGWIDAQTGHAVLTGPPGWSPTGSGAGGYMPDTDHVEFGGHTFVRVPCVQMPKPALHASVPLKATGDLPMSIGSHVSIGIGTGDSETKDDGQPGFIVFGQ